MRRMPIVDFVTKESELPRMPIVLAAIAAGAAQTASLVVTNSAAGMLYRSDTLGIRIFLLYCLAIAIFIFAQTYSLKRAIEVVEDATFKARMRIADKIRHSAYPFIEGKNKGEIHLNLTQDANSISHSSIVLVMAAQAFFVLTCCFLYIMWLSIAAFVLLFGLLIVVYLAYLPQSRMIQTEMYETHKKEGYFFQLLNHILSGFKELKLHDPKNDALYEDVQEVSAETKKAKIRVGRRFVLNFFASNVLYGLFLGSVVFLLPRFSDVDITTIVKVITGALFIMGPLFMLIYALPQFSRANSAVLNIMRLEDELDNANKMEIVRKDGRVSERAIKKYYDFQTLQFQGVEYHYFDDQQSTLFKMGPIDLSVKRGEILFITGGNGSGKTTFLKVATGLYSPAAGRIMVDENVIASKRNSSYRNLFSAVFTDFHLFDKFYGISDVTEEKVDHFIKWMQLEDKTDYESERFTNLNLSTGQRKRLGLIMALLEDRPILVLDELAADQDPGFRKIFYTEILPRLKSTGRAIIAATHDDTYWHVADRLIQFSDGCIVEKSPKNYLPETEA